MKIILRQDVETLGKTGDIIRVADGYARNYLIPKGLALEANEKSIRSLEHTKKLIAQKAEKQRKDAETLRERFSGLVCTIARKVGQNEKLFGSVTNKDIEEALGAQDIHVNRKDIVLEEQIRALGEFPARIKLHPGITVDFTVKVVEEKEG